MWKMYLALSLALMASGCSFMFQPHLKGGLAKYEATAEPACSDGAGLIALDVLFAIGGAVGVGIGSSLDDNDENRTLIMASGFADLVIHGTSALAGVHWMRECVKANELWAAKQPKQLEVAPAAVEPEPEQPWTPPVDNGGPIQVLDMPALKRADRVEQTTAVAGVVVEVAPAGAAGWAVTVRNTSTGIALIVWDESSFVDSSKRATGRLIRGDTRKIDTAKAQPPTPIPPNAEAQEVAFAEQMTNAEESEAKIAEVKRPSQELIKKVIAIREAREIDLIGGTINLTLQIGADKHVWIGRVVAADGGK